MLSVIAARTLSTPSPFLPLPRAHRIARLFWTAVVLVCRFFMIFVRAIPEYIWAFLLLAVFGPTAWPLVLALAVHNLGVLGRLGAEAIENSDSSPLAGLRALGARRLQLVTSALFPLVSPRFLLFFLY